MSFGFRMRQAVQQAATSALSPYTKLLLHMDGVAGSPAAPTDEAGAVVTSGSAAELTTSVFKFGTRSAVGGTNKHFYYPADAKYNPGSGQFTLELWLRTGFAHDNSSFVSIDAVGSSLGSTGISLTRLSSSGTVAYVFVNGVSKSMVLANFYDDSTFRHFCLERGSDDYMRLYINGTHVNSAASAGGNISVFSGGTPRVSVGANAGALDYPTTATDYIDEVRYTVGTAVYNVGASNFTAPTGPFTT